MSMHLPESKELRRKINEDLNVRIRLRITKFNCQRKFTNGSPQLLFKSLQLVAVLYLHPFLLIIFTRKPRSIQSYCKKQTRNIRFTFPSFNFLSGKNILYAPAVTYLNSRRFMWHQKGSENLQKKKSKKKLDWRIKFELDSTRLALSAKWISL